jgi:hypothetical protein
MSLVVTFSCLLLSCLGAADHHAGRGSGGDPPSSDSQGQHPCLLLDGDGEQQALPGPPHGSRQRRPRAFTPCAYGDDPSGPPPHYATMGHGGGHVLHSSNCRLGHGYRLASAG